MKLWFLLAALLSLNSLMLAQRDGGGKDVRVAIFSIHTVRAITLTGLNEDAWYARCAHCSHETLRVPQQLQGPGEWFAGGSVRVRDEASGEERTATGLWDIRANADALDIVLTMPSERYVAAVLAAEAAPHEPSESLQALAILARTYALNGSHYTTLRGHLPADLCDSTECQAMRLGPVSHAVEDAVRTTAGETLWYKAQRAEVFFSQNCGGYTEDAGVLWPALAGKPYLSAHADPYCTKHGLMQWHAEIPLSTFQQVAQREGWHLPRLIVSALVSQRTASHRALRIVFSGSDGRTAEVSASAIRFAIGSALGWNRVQSDAYDLHLQGTSLIFDGRGRGHGAGLCQVGAAEMARDGKSAEAILAFYFRGTHIGISAADTGWQQVELGNLRVQHVGSLSSTVIEAIKKNWGEAQRRFSPRRQTDATLILTPSTEVFRQWTAQPGWMLASTRGSEMVLQPEPVLKVNGGMERVLLHEMLHLLVEAEATAKAPLWLREGLVEVLAGETNGIGSGLPLAVIESKLRRPDTWHGNLEAHHAASAAVQRMIDSYGFSTVRGWLSSGVPEGVTSR